MKKDYHGKKKTVEILFLKMKYDYVLKNRAIENNLMRLRN